MLDNLQILFSRLFDPEYAHLLLEPIAFFGLLFSLIFFAVGHYMGQPKCRMIALILIAACSLSVVPDLALRKKALAQETSARPADAKLIKEQYQRRLDHKWVYYAVAIIACLALLGGGKIGSIANLVVLGGGFLAVLFSAWLHMKEAEIYHSTIVKHAIPVR
jgi:hypothetical protein